MFTLHHQNAFMFMMLLLMLLLLLFFCWRWLPDPSKALLPFFPVFPFQFDVCKHFGVFSRRKNLWWFIAFNNTKKIYIRENIHKKCLKFIFSSLCCLLFLTMSASVAVMVIWAVIFLLYFVPPINILWDFPQKYCDIFFMEHFHSCEKKPFKSFNFLNLFVNF